MLLTVTQLHTYFNSGDSVVKAVEGISFSIDERETVALVGESGCGKSITALSIMRLFPGKCSISGSIIFDNIDLLELPERKMRKIRGNSISMIFQEPMTSLNPLHKVGDQVAEVISVHQKISRVKAYRQVLQMFQTVGISDPENRMKSYPFQLSGGLRQRVMIAIALACRPALLIADEPTTALDVTIQAQILQQMKDLKESFQTAILFITHDLGVVAEIADRVLVMYAGHIVEEAGINVLFTAPHHPYTKGLLKSIPLMKGPRKCMLPVIKGIVPSAHSKPEGCPFHPRCSQALERCQVEKPVKVTLDKNQKHAVQCWLYA